MKKFSLLIFALVFAVNTFGQTSARAYDVQRYIIRSSFDRPNKTFFGDVTIELKPLKDNFRQFELDAAEMKFDFVKIEPAGTNLGYKQSGEKLVISLDKNYSANDSISVHLKYASKPTKGVYFVDASENHPA